MKKVLHYYNVAKEVALVTYKEWSAYRTHSMISIIVGPVYFLVQYFIWTAVYGGKETLNGMELQQMLRYFGASALIGYLTMDFADWNLQMLVRTGKFVTFQLRPVHHRFFALSQKLGHRVLGLLVEFIPCFFIFHFIFHINMVPEYIGWTVLSVLLAFFMNFYVNYCIGLTAFWLVQSSGIRSVFQALASVFSGGLIPLVFFPKYMQKLLFFLPFQYILYVPSRVFSGSYSLAGISMKIWQIVLLQGVAVVITMLLSEILYRKSLKKFTAAGG
ncbi:ABC transporter permease [Anaeromicropila populeti]|uniref:ABC-2 type transport system permease protein n=1 Tax=Anaeromicropila populeti TaxID=37658 RepID=A0A1I6JNX7_9FIRM|nr:ABC-2 family transporter protein [Anaeromicropila populeti]SFR80659.1 ABC-2 type transport system permease protein [Anaeromicropila populeti]